MNIYIWHVVSYQSLTCMSLFACKLFLSFIYFLVSFLLVLSFLWKTWSPLIINKVSKNKCSVLTEDFVPILYTPCVWGKMGKLALESKFSFIWIRNEILICVFSFSRVELQRFNWLLQKIWIRRSLLCWWCVCPTINSFLSHFIFCLTCFEIYNLWGTILVDQWLNNIL